MNNTKLDQVYLKDLKDNQKSKIKLAKLDDEVTLFLEPAREHNHHMAVFLKKSAGSGQIDFGDGCQYDVYKAIYLYRQGLSTSIDPIVLKDDESRQPKLVHDYGILLSLFYNQVKRAKDFEQGFAVVDQSETNNAKLWTPAKFKKELVAYFKSL
jgi:hypothetical protein